MVENIFSLQIKSKGKTKEGVVDPVTLGDMLSHEQMYFGLAKMFPNLLIVSEEKSQTIPDSSTIPAMDLDTTEISKKLGLYFCISNLFLKLYFT